MRRAASLLVCVVVVFLGGCFLFNSGILYDETWSDPNTTSWTLGNTETYTTSIASGRYHFRLKQAVTWFCWNTSEGPFGDAQFDVDVKHEEGTDNLSAGGLVFRLVDGQDAYVFQISAVGTFRITEWVAGVMSPLAAWTPSDAINKGAAQNHLTVLAEGTSLTFLINSTEVAELADSSFSTGHVGVCVQAFSADVDVEESFDNLVVRELE